MTTRTTSHRRSVPMRSKRKWKLKLRVWLGDSTSPRGKGESRSFFFSTRGDAEQAQDILIWLDPEPCLSSQITINPQEVRK